MKKQLKREVEKCYSRLSGLIDEVNDIKDELEGIANELENDSSDYDAIERAQANIETSVEFLQNSCEDLILISNEEKNT